MTPDCHHCHRSALTFELSAWHPSGGIVARLRCAFCGRATTTFVPANQLDWREEVLSTMRRNASDIISGLPILPDGLRYEFDESPLVGRAGR